MTRRGWYTGFLAACLGASWALAGPSGEVSIQPTHVTLSLDGGTLELQPLASDALRVRYFEGPRVSPESFVFSPSSKPPTFSVSQTSESVTIATDRVRAVVTKSTGQVTFSDETGRVFLAERTKGRTWTPTVIAGVQTHRVGQEFESSADEKLFGLGQFQDGLWNWKGIPVELRQLNTQIALPMVISNHGYGVLWNNASRTDFNDPGQAISLTPLSLRGAESKGPTATEQLAGQSGSRKDVLEQKGQFTTDQAGDYVFCTRDGDRRGDVSIWVNGVQVAGVSNMWTPRAIVGVMRLPAKTLCNIQVRGGGSGVKLFARPLGTTTLFRSDCGDAVDYTVFFGPDWDRVIGSYRQETGTVPLWPKWAFGFWQCRERYTSQKHLIDTALEFRRQGFPMDLLVQDWMYWGPHGWGSYEWDESQYPDPKSLIQSLHDQNVKFMISVWSNPSGQAGEEFKNRDLMVGGWVDVFSPKGRDLRWKHLNHAFFSKGTDAWWGDATEPGDAGTDLLGKKVSMGLGDQYTGAYPLFATQSIYDGQRASNPEKRVVILTRSSFPGQQRFGAAAWSGDINGDWTTFRRQIPAGLNYCVTGQPYWTTDCGGFFRPSNQHLSKDYNELLVRWFQWSTFCPVMRVHGYQTETEPWKWLPETQHVLRAYDELRYRLLPFLYSEAWRVTSQGATFMRPLSMDFPNDPQTWAIHDAYLFGSSFLVAPITDPGVGSRNVYLPAGSSWIDFWTGKTQRGGQWVDAAAPLDRLPLFVKAGALIPMGPQLQYANEKAPDPLELRIYSGADGTYRLYEDEGDSYRYEQGIYSIIPLEWNEKTQTLTLGARQGSFPGMLKERTFRVVVVSPKTGLGMQPATLVTEVRYSGSPVTLQPTEKAVR